MSLYGFPDTDERIPALKWNTIDKYFELRNWNPDTGTTEPTPLSKPVRLALDLGTVRLGYVNFAAFNFDHVAPAGHPNPPTKPEGKDEEGKDLFQKVAIFLAFSPDPDIRLRQWICSGAYLLNLMLGFLGECEATKTAQHGQIPVVDWIGELPRKVKAGKGAGRVYHMPKLEIIGWMPRPAHVFGERTVPLPEPRPTLQWGETLKLHGPGVEEVAPGVVMPSGKIVDDEIPF